MEQPNLKEKKELVGIFKKEGVKIPRTKKVYKIGYMKGYTLEKLSDISLWLRTTSSPKTDSKGNVVARTIKEEKIITKARMKVAAKEASYGILNGMKIYFFHWFYWRYIYYIKGYTYDQLEPILQEIKKKTPLRAYTKAITFGYIMDITTLNLSEEEQKEVLVELTSDREDNSEKNTNG